MVFALVVTAELLAMILVLGSGKPAVELWRSLSMVSLYVQWIALSSAGILCLLRLRLRRLGNGAAGVIAWLIVVLVTVIVTEIAYWIMYEGGQARLLDPDGHLGWMLKSLAVSSIVAVLALRYFYLQFLWRKQVEAESDARLQALQSRIRPHFLFNSMNTIANLTRTNPRLAEEVVNDLADLFRVSLSDARHGSTLGEELELARRYLNIERQRLGNRLRVHWDLKGLPEDAWMPALVLQPLLENAVYHGIEPATGPGTIHISGRYARNRINLGIRNTVPTEETRSHRKGNRLAMDNIRQRLAARFEEAASLTESKVDGEHQVRLVIPYPWEDR